MSKRHLLATRVFSVAAASILSACAAFGPPRTPPSVASPAHYSIAPSSPQLPADHGPPQQLELGAPPVPEWWHAFASPSLDVLVSEALDKNQSLAAAKANLRAAHEQVREQVGNNLYP
ncbi:MAG TPA: hypothetical protein VGI35_02325, partial [Steroidobacteraceae bacterium]